MDRDFFAANSVPDDLVLSDLIGKRWSDLSESQPKPVIDQARLRKYRQDRLRAQLERHDCAFVMVVNPVALRYACDYRNYALFQSHIPTTYCLIPRNPGEPRHLYGAYGGDPDVDKVLPGRPISYFDGGDELAAWAEVLATDLAEFLAELGSDNRRIALEYCNPTLVQACERRGLEVIDGVLITEAARMIKSADEIACMRWAIAIAQHGIDMMARAIQPGVSELQLWALLNYCNLANNGDWHDGRMLASGDKINPWLQEANERQLEAGDLVGFDTDMVGPYGYFADISRTMFCGPGQPSRAQREVYRLAHAEVTHNMQLVKPGVTFEQFREQAFVQDEKYWEQAYSCLVHAVGMCDEAPQIKHIFRGPSPYPGVLEAGMVLCIESYVGAVGERDGVKLEQQVLVTETGYEPLSTYPWDERLLD